MNALKTLKTIQFANLFRIVAKSKESLSRPKGFRPVSVGLFFVLAGFFAGCTSRNSYQSYETLNNFQLSSPKAEVVELKHKKSGARLVLLKNSDPSRTFMAAFRTPPYDDTGLFHIFEHTVLGGSRLYPSKSNFFRVAKSTVASFINAMTGSVNTTYPFVTRDPRDFNNLLSVYMDAVFFPKTIKDPRIVEREGWRYEVDPKTKKMSINGIVLSEMKGAFSSPYKTLRFHLNRSVLPQTPYANESGGLPEKISTLHFDQIVEAHKKYYHPQNSIIYLYGDIDYKKTLATIDREFLSHFSKTPGFTPPDIPLQTDFNYPGKVVEATYPGPKAPNKDFVTKTYVLGSLTPLQRNASQVLVQAFVSKPASPLRIRILKEGFAQSLFSIDPESKDNAFSFVFEGTEASQQQKLEEALQEELDKVVRQGLDQELLNSILNKYEFYYKNKNSNGSHRGLGLGFSVVNNWLYPDLPLEEDLDIMGQFKELRQLLSDKSFVKNFFKKYFKKNTRSLWLVMKPDPLFSEKFNAGLEKNVQEALKTKPLAEYVKKDKTFRQWVVAEEPPEITDKTPLLKLSDITVDEKPIPFYKSKMGSTEVIEYPQETSGISYVKLFFDLKGVKEENLKNLELFTSLLMKTDTSNHPFRELSKQIDTYAGQMDFSVSTYQSIKNPEEFKPTLFVSLSFLNENRKKNFAILKELLTESQFSPVEHVDNLVKEIQVSMANSVSYRGRYLAAKASKKSFFPTLGAFDDERSGVVFQKYILKSKIDPKSLSSNLKTMLKSIFNKNRLYLATITADQKELKKSNTELGKLKNSLSSQESEDQKWSFSDQKNYDGYIIPGEVQYVIQTTSFKDEGLKYNGAMKVYSQYLNSHFMIPRLREQSGAYGASSYFAWNGLFGLSTYKDPNLKKSFDIFSQSVDFMKNEKLDQEKLRPAILGSLKPFYSDKSISSNTDFMTNLYLNDRSWEDYIRVKKEILSTTPEDFKKINEALSSALKKSKKAVAGNPDKIRKEAPFLKEVLSL